MAKVKVERTVSVPMVPVGVRCRLCRLYVDEDNAVELEIHYGGFDVMPQNPLCALNRTSWICGDCVTAIREAA